MTAKAAFSAVLILGATLLSRPLAVGQGDEVAVVYNSNLPESKWLAEYYAQRRRVPSYQLFGLNLPLAEVVTRREFRDLLQQPLLKRLERILRLQLCMEPHVREGRHTPGGRPSVDVSEFLAGTIKTSDTALMVEFAKVFQLGAAIS